ncbi:hypothetical protein [Streptomyces sp. Qhu-G9]|uniref:hypothetical protein n=1 Tax=Streptomyces sp. Qhu-G9 TaxID=3452799 RepID=UPI0022ABFC69|nr:hypothetical protein [Streptomyces aurantiacus]
MGIRSSLDMQQRWRDTAIRRVNDLCRASERLGIGPVAFIVKHGILMNRRWIIFALILPVQVLCGVCICFFGWMVLTAFLLAITLQGVEIAWQEGEVPAFFAVGPDPFSDGIEPVAIIAGLVAFCIVTPLLFRLGRQFVSRSALDNRRARWHNYNALWSLTEAVIGCSEVYKNRGWRRDKALTALPVQLTRARNVILLSHTCRGTVPLFSARQRQVKRHAGQVAAVLKNLEARLDTDPDSAVRELGSALLTIAERYAQGRVGALLSEEQIGDIQPVQDHEARRLLAAGAMTCLLTAVLLKIVEVASLPSAMEPVVIAISALTALMAAYGHRATHRLDILGILGGSR